MFRDFSRCLFHRDALLQLLICFLLLSACAPKSSIEPGVIPGERKFSSADEEYGYKVAYELSKQFPLDDDRDANDQVRRVVRRLSTPIRGRSSWKVYVFQSREFKNAAATRGNFVFVWTPLLRFVRNDAELAAVLSHEMAHVLAGHTENDPLEESKEILTGAAGRIGSRVITGPGATGLAAGLAGMVLEQSLKAVLVNPGLQAKEYDADQIGLFLMADAGYDPREGISFWQRATRDPDLAGSSIDILSSHPSSVSRLERLQEILPQAEERYLHPAAGNRNFSHSPDNPVRHGKNSTRDGITPVFERRSLSSVIVGEIPPRTGIVVRNCEIRWCEIEEPIPGYVRLSDLEEQPAAAP